MVCPAHSISKIKMQYCRPDKLWESASESTSESMSESASESVTESASESTSESPSESASPWNEHQTGQKNFCPAYSIAFLSSLQHCIFIFIRGTDFHGQTIFFPPPFLKMYFSINKAP